MSASDFEFGFHHGAISVENMKATKAWYKHVLGFEVEREFEIPSIPAQVAILQNGGLRMEVFEVPMHNLCRVIVVSQMRTIVRLEINTSLSPSKMLMHLASGWSKEVRISFGLNACRMGRTSSFEIIQAT
jgi:hypothetical protein